MYEITESTCIDDIQYYGFRFTDIEAATSINETKNLKISGIPYKYSQPKRNTLIPSQIRTGQLFYINKGSTNHRSHPYIVSDVEYNSNPNENTTSLSISFEPTYDNANRASLYMQTATDPKQTNTPVNFHSYCEYSLWKPDRSMNGSISILPDRFIIHALKEQLDSTDVAAYHI